MMKNSKVISLILAAVLVMIIVLSGPITASSSGGGGGGGGGSSSSSITLSVNAPERASAGALFSVWIDINEIEDLDAASYQLNYDADVLELDEVNPGNINGTEIPVFGNPVSEGCYRVVQNLEGLEGVSGEGYLTEYIFQAVGETGDSSYIYLSDRVISTVLAEEIIPVTSSALVEIGLIRGDADEDGNLDAVDITTVERMIAGLVSENSLADANNDGDIDSLDITTIERLIVGLEGEIPVDPGDPVYGGTLTILNALSPSKNVGWPAETNFQAIWYIMMYAEPLVYFTASAGIEPCLAESWEVDSSAETPSVTFTLRQGVKFQDGSDFTADAVKFQADAVIANGQTNAVMWESVDILDDYTVRFNLTTFTNSFWNDIYNPNMYIVAPGPVRENGVDWAREHPVGTGPFNMVKYEKDTGASFEKNENYWVSGKPYLDKIECVVIQDIMTQQISMQSGIGDVMLLQDGKVMSDMKAAGFNTIQKPGGSSIIVPDTVNPSSKFADIRVREAIDCGIDKVKVAEATGYGYMFASGQLPPLGNPAYDETIPDTSYDVAKAKQLLAEAGYPNGFKTKLITWSYDQDYCLVIQQQLANIGIQAEMDVQDNLKFIDAWMNGWEDACLVLSASSGPNFAATVKQQLPPYGIFYKSMAVPEGMKDLIDACLATDDIDEQLALNKQLTRMIYDDKSLIVYMTGGLGAVINSRVKNADWLFGADMYYSFRVADTYIED